MSNRCLLDTVVTKVCWTWDFRGNSFFHDELKKESSLVENLVYFVGETGTPAEVPAHTFMFFDHWGS